MQTLSLPLKTTSVQDWYGYLKKNADDSTWVSSQLRDWKKLLSPSLSSHGLMSETFETFSKVKNSLTIEKNVNRLFFELDAETTKLLVTNQVCLRAYRARLDEVLISALVVSLFRWKGETTG